MSSTPKFGFVRVVKLCKIFRVVKMLKFMSQFGELRILLTTLALSMWSLFWAMLLVGVFVIASGLIMFQMCAPIVQDASADLEQREWIYANFGTASIASYSMFEATFSSGWLSKAHYLITEVHVAFAIFWVVYIVVVNFAFMRVVAALFLKQTMFVASVDAERMAVEKMQRKEKVAQILADIFKQGDTSGDGSINAEEFMVMLTDKAILDMFEKLDIELPELKLLFQMLADDDGLAAYDEFLGAALKMKASARNIDAVQILHQLGVLRRELHSLADNHEALGQNLGEFAAQVSAVQPDRQAQRHADRESKARMLSGGCSSSTWERSPGSTDILAVVA